MKQKRVTLRLQVTVPESIPRHEVALQIGIWLNQKRKSLDAYARVTQEDPIEEKKK